MEISDILKLDGLLATIDIQKAFDSADHAFIISTLERYGFGNRFVRWVKILLKTQYYYRETCKEHSRKVLALEFYHIWIETSNFCNLYYHKIAYLSIL